MVIVFCFLIFTDRLRRDVVMVCLFWICMNRLDWDTLREAMRGTE